MIRTDPGQPNLIDGTILAFDPTDGGAYVTFAGMDGQPIIASIDCEDLHRLGSAVLDSATSFDPNSSQEERARITPRGVDVIRDQLAGGGS